MAAIDFDGTSSDQPSTPTYGSGLDFAKSQIANAYKTYLGREGSDQEYLSHLNGGRDIAQSNIDYAIRNIQYSPEAQAYAQKKNQPAPPPPPPAPTSGARPGAGATRDQILAYLSNFAQAHPNANPSLTRDPNYWADRILQTHPNGNVDWNYWEGRFLTPEGAPETGTGGTQTNVPGVNVPSYQAQFDDPSTKNLENWMTQRLNELNQPVNDPSRAALAALLDEQTQMLQAQRAQQQADAERLKARQAQATQSADDLVNFLRSRAATLQGPAYTGAESEVLRTQALDPIEADRQAARQRALQEISRRGLDPSSGIAQQLLNDVDASFDRSRASAQNELAYRTIAEQRSREQEAQQLLGYIPQVQTAANNADLDFLNSLYAAVNQPEQGAIATAGQSAALGQQVRNEEQGRRQEALAISSLLQQLPTTALQQALAAAGLGPSPESIANTAISLYGIGQQQRNQGLNWYETLGMALPYLTGAFSGGGSNSGAQYGLGVG